MGHIDLILGLAIYASTALLTAVLLKAPKLLDSSNEHLRVTASVWITEGRGISMDEYYYMLFPSALAILVTGLSGMGFTAIAVFVTSFGWYPVIKSIRTRHINTPDSKLSYTVH